MKGYSSNGREVDLFATTDNSLPYQLTIWKKSGNSRLMQLGNWDSTEDYRCAKNVFDVQVWDTRYGGGVQWEKGLSEIVLTLDNCQAKENSKRKECSIKIGDGVGLKWKEEFTPKVIV